MGRAGEYELNIVASHSCTEVSVPKQKVKSMFGLVAFTYTVQLSDTTMMNKEQMLST